MFKFLKKILFLFLANFLALLAAGYFIPGVHMLSGWRGAVWAAAILAALNLFLRPLLKMIFAPLVILIFGLGVILANMAGLYTLEKFTPQFEMAGLLPLLYATLVIAAVNFLAHWIFKE